MNILINPKTKQQLLTFATRPTHALMLVGEPGSGLDDIAQFVVDSIASMQQSTIYTSYIQRDEKGTISIDSIRQLRNMFKHKLANGLVTRAVVIESAESMPHEAQNALLKLLEEPPVGSLFILPIHNLSQALATIQSRASKINVLPVSYKTAIDYFNNADPTLLKTMYEMSQGQPGTLMRFMQADDDTELLSIRLAKDVLRSNVHDRLIMIEKLFKKRDEAIAIVASLTRVCQAAIKHNPTKKSWQHNMRQCLDAQKNLEANIQPKIVLSLLFLELS